MIVDDEKFIREELKYILGQIKDISVCCETGEGDDVIPLIERYSPDVVFLDIHLQTQSGLLIAEKIGKLEHAPHIVMATAYDNYALNGFDVGAVDYLVKPFDEERIGKCVEKLQKIMIDKLPVIQDGNNRITIQDQGRYYLIDLDGIIYLEYLDNRVIVHTIDKDYKTSMTLREFEQNCSSKDFIRIHKAFIVNASFIKEIIPWFNATLKLVLKGENEIEVFVSRSYAKAFRKKIGL
jgi:DNA-binding LytR/AlgR family response regulator